LTRLTDLAEERIRLVRGGSTTHESESVVIRYARAVEMTRNIRFDTITFTESTNLSAEAEMTVFAL